MEFYSNGESLRSNGKLKEKFFKTTLLKIIHLTRCISIVGLGRVGLATATVFASMDIKVIGVEKDKHKLSQIRDGKPPFYEPKLKNMLGYVIKNKYLTLTEDISSIQHSSFTFITVG